MSAFRFVPSTIAAATITIAAVTFVTFSTNLASPSESAAPQEKVQPLDPLTNEETRVAAQVASADPKVKAALGSGRQRLIQVEFFAQKPAQAVGDPDRLEIGRHASVLFYRYTGDQGIHVVVDLRQRAVVSITRLEGRAVPLGVEEIGEAFNLAARNERVRSLLGSEISGYRVANLAEGDRPENRVEGLRVVATSPKDPCYRHRCIYLLFHSREGYLAGTTVNVDLTAQTVRAERTIR